MSVAPVLLLAALLAQAAPLPSPAPGDEVGWHEVEPGDTLEGLTARHLGSPARWRDNWALNPELKDPHRLQPGTRIRIIMRSGANTAEIRALSRRVEEKPHPADWKPATVGARLRERDGVRTHERSSAELAFSDGTSLVVTERSVLFLREAGRAGSTPRTLEVVEGQADVEMAAAEAPRRPDLEVVIGSAKAATRPGPDGRSRARARRQTGQAQVMVYGGTGVVSAGGVRQPVAEGMGTRVLPGSRPSPPERLLPAPATARPQPNEALDHSNVRFAWDAVPGAASYVLEVCADPACGQLVERAREIAGTGYEARRGLPMGTLHWRVTAVSSTGLDGYPSTPVPFSVRSLWRRPQERR